MREFAMVYLCVAAASLVTIMTIMLKQFWRSGLESFFLRDPGDENRLSAGEEALLFWLLAHVALAMALLWPLTLAQFIHAEIVARGTRS